MLTNFEVLHRLLLSLFFSGLIGLERQIHRRSAGLRTHILVSLGACLIMLTSLYVFDIYKDKASVDPARIAAGIITGVGFLGAGTIIVERGGVRGLTTAASLWIVAAIGMAAGCGFYSAAFFTCLLTLAVLLILRYVETLVLGVTDKSKGGDK